jgi:hypothetical protein
MATAPMMAQTPATPYSTRAAQPGPPPGGSVPSRVLTTYLRRDFARSGHAAPLRALRQAHRPENNSADIGSDRRPASSDEGTEVIEVAIVTDDWFIGGHIEVSICTEPDRPHCGQPVVEVFADVRHGPGQVIQRLGGKAAPLMQRMALEPGPVARRFGRNCRSASSTGMPSPVPRLARSLASYGGPRPSGRSRSCRTSSWPQLMWEAPAAPVAVILAPRGTGHSAARAMSARTPR